MVLRFGVSKLLKSIDLRFVQFVNMLFMFETFLVSKFETLILVKDSQKPKMCDISVTLLVSNLVTSTLSREEQYRNICVRFVVVFVT